MLLWLLSSTASCAGVAPFRHTFLRMCYKVLLLLCWFLHRKLCLHTGKKGKLCLRNKTIKSELAASFSPTWEKLACSRGGSMQGSRADNDSSLFTLIIPSPVSADGWKHKGASVSLFKVWTLPEQSRMRKPGAESLERLRFPPEAGQECEWD